MAPERLFLKAIPLGRKGRKSHSHIAFVTVDVQTGQGEGQTSIDHDHAHVVSYDPQSGQFIISTGADGHEHELVPVPTQDYQPEKQSDDEVVSDVLRLFADGLEREDKQRRSAVRSEKFYRGEQWDEAIKRELEESRRAALTINKIQPGIKRLVGWQRQTRTDIRYAPVEDGDQRAADLFNYVSKNILEQCYYDREESKVFEDICIPGRGAFNLYVDTESDLQGRIVVERYPALDVVFGPHEKEDASDLEWLIKHRMMSKAKLRQLWGDKVDDVQKNYDSLLQNPQTHVTYAEDQYGKSENTKNVTSLLPAGMELCDMARKEYRLLECWRKVYRPVTIVIDPNSEFVFRAEGWSSDDVAKLKTIPGLRLLKKEVAKMRITRIAGTTLLSDENPAELPIDDFHIIPVYGNKRNDDWWGEVEIAVDPQIEVNKRRSQSIDVVNRCANYGFWYDEGTFPSEKEEEQFRAEVSTPGFALKVASVDRPPRKEEGVKFPVEIVNMMQIAEETVRDLLSVQIENVGANTSGAAMMQAQRIGLIGHEHLFDSLSFAKKKLGRMLLYAIRAFYTPERIYRIVSHVAKSQPEESPLQIGQQDFEEFSQEEIVEIIENSDVGKIDVVVIEGESSPTEQIATYMLLLEMAKAGQPVPPQLMIKVLPGLPAKYRQELISAITQGQEQSAQAEQSKSDAEIAKTLVAKGQIPPEIAKRFGIQGTPQPSPMEQQQPNTEGGLAGGGIQ